MLELSIQNFLESFLWEDNLYCFHQSGDSRSVLLSDNRLLFVLKKEIGHRLLKHLLYEFSDGYVYYDCGRLLKRAFFYSGNHERLLRVYYHSYSIEDKLFNFVGYVPECLKDVYRGIRRGCLDDSDLDNSDEG